MQFSRVSQVGWAKKSFILFGSKGYVSLKFDDIEHFLDFEPVKNSCRTWEDMILAHEKPFMRTRLYSMTMSTCHVFSRRNLSRRNTFTVLSQKVSGLQIRNGDDASMRSRKKASSFAYFLSMISRNGECWYAEGSRCKFCFCTQFAHG